MLTCWTTFVALDLATPVAVNREISGAGPRHTYRFLHVKQPSLERELDFGRSDLAAAECAVRPPSGSELADDMPFDQLERTSHTGKERARRGEHFWRRGRKCGGWRRRLARPPPIGPMPFSSKRAYTQLIN